MKKSRDLAVPDVHMLEFSASAYGTAIAMQLRILEAERSDSKSRQLYGQNKKRMSEIRSLLEDIARSDSVVLDKPVGLELQQHYAWLEETLDGAGQVRPRDLGVYFKGPGPREK